MSLIRVHSKMLGSYEYKRHCIRHEPKDKNDLLVIAVIDEPDRFIVFGDWSAFSVQPDKETK